MMVMEITTSALALCMFVSNVIQLVCSLEKQCVLYPLKAARHILIFDSQISWDGMLPRYP